MKRGLRFRFIRRAKLFLSELHGVTFPSTPKHKDLLNEIERVLEYEPNPQFNRMEQAVAAMEGKMTFVGRIGRQPLRKPKPTKQSNEAFYLSREWRAVRYQALAANDGRCELCGSSRNDGVRLHVDHIMPRSKFPALELEPTNLQVLCEPCNLGKSNRCTRDWRNGPSSDDLATVGAPKR